MAKKQETKEMTYGAATAMTQEEVNAQIQVENGLGFKTSMHVSTDPKVNPFISKAAMTDGTVAFESDPESVKEAFDAQDERTLSGNSWDTASAPFS